MKNYKEWVEENEIWYEKYYYFKNRSIILGIIGISLVLFFTLIPFFNQTVWDWKPPLVSGTGWFLALMFFVFLMILVFSATFNSKITTKLIYETKKITHNGFVFYWFDEWLFSSVDDVEYFVENKEKILANKDEEFVLGVDYWLKKERLAKKEEE